MSIFDTTQDRLDVHERQGVDAAIITAFRALHEAEIAIDKGDLTSGGALKQKLTRREALVHEIVGLQLALEANAERQSDRALQAHERAEHERVTTADGHAAIDLDRVRVATSAAELAVMLAEARAHSTDGARRAWKFIEPKLREMAAREQQRHVIGTGATAFGVLCRLQGEMRDLSRGVPDRAAIVDAGQRRARELRRQVLAVAQVFGLERQVEMALRRASVPEGAAPTTGMLSGGWFDRFGKK